MRQATRNVKREPTLSPCPTRGTLFDLQNMIRDSSSAVAAPPPGVSSLTWTAGESPRRSFFSNRWPDWGWLGNSEAIRVVNDELVDNDGAEKRKRGKHISQMSNFEQRAGTEEHTLFVLRLGSLEHDRESVAFTPIRRSIKSELQPPSSVVSARCNLSVAVSVSVGCPRSADAARLHRASNSWVTDLRTF